MKKRNILYKIFMCICVCILLAGCSNNDKCEEIDNNKNNVTDKTDIGNENNLIDNNQNTPNKDDNKEENKNDTESNKNDNKTDKNENTSNEVKENNPKLNVSSKTLEKGKTLTLKVTDNKETVSWMTSDKNVATVSNGKVTAVGKGTATITASVDGKKLTCKVTVKESTSNTTTNNTTSNSNTNTNTEANNTVTNPKLNSTNVTINEDETYQLKVTGNKGKVQWMTVDSSIAIVDNSGVIRPTKAGKTTVQAIVDGKTLTCNVTVKEVKVEASVSKEAFNYINDKRKAEGLPLYTWDSSMENNVKIRAKECLIQYSHVRPNGTPGTSIGNVRGEALSGKSSASIAVNSWYSSSSGHKELLLSNEFTNCVVAKIYNKNIDSYIWVAHFK